MASLRPAIDQISEKTMQTGNQRTATRVFCKWGPLIFCRARTWGYPAAWRKKWTLGSSITLAASCAPEKMEKKGENKWQSESITWKRIMSPVKSTLCSMSSCVVEIGFWKPYILLTPFKPHQFEVSFLRPVLMPQKSNKEFVHDFCSHFNLRLVRIWLGVPPDSHHRQCLWWESEEKIRKGK